jgi:hypothetical protein
MSFSPPVPKSPDHRIIFLNATALKSLSCEDRYYHQCVSGWTDRVENPIFSVGKAIHKFAEEMAKGTDEIEAMSMGCKQPGVTDKAAIAKACAGYRAAGHYPPLIINGETFVEQRFCVPFTEVVKDNLTYEVYLVGRFDHVAHTKHGVVITDYKSTRKWDFGDVTKAYADDVQFLFYYCVARQYAYEIFNGDMAVANDAWNGRLFTRVCAIMLSKKPQPQWMMGPLWSPPEHLWSEFLTDLRTHVVPKIVNVHHRQYLPRRDGLFKNLCPGCNYADLCLREQPEAYERRTYSPLTW